MKIALALAAALLLAGCGGTAASGSASTPPAAQGFLNPTTLEASIKTQADKKIAAEGLTVKSVTCIETSQARTFTCLADLSDGTTSTATATVSADGSSYVTQ